MQFAHHWNMEQRNSIFPKQFDVHVGFWAAIRLLNPLSSRTSWTNCSLILHGKSAALGQLGLLDLAWLYRPGILMNVFPRAKRTSSWSSLWFLRAQHLTALMAKKQHPHVYALIIAAHFPYSSVFPMCFYAVHLPCLGRPMFQSPHPQDEVGPCLRKTTKSMSSLVPQRSKLIWVSKATPSHLKKELSRQYPFRMPGMVIIRQDLCPRHVNRINESLCLTID